MTARSLIIFVAFVGLTVGAAADKDCTKTGSGKCCAETQFGKCFAVHGRYAVYVKNNGIWVIGEKRLVTTAGDGDLDQMIYNRGDWQDFDLDGDFTVCPRSSFEQGQMQQVCVQSYKNIRVTKRLRNH